MLECYRGREKTTNFMFATNNLFKYLHGQSQTTEINLALDANFRFLFDA